MCAVAFCNLSMLSDALRCRGGAKYTSFNSEKPKDIYQKLQVKDKNTIILSIIIYCANLNRWMQKCCVINSHLIFPCH